MKSILLKEGKDFTYTRLADYLNEIHKTKKSGKIFFPQDIQQYLVRGNLPKYLGGQKISRVKNSSGLKIIRIHGSLEKVV